MIDSNKLFTEVVSNLLEDNGHQVIAKFTNARDFLKKVDAMDVDVLVIDFFQSKLPKPNVFLNQHALTKKLKVIALTENTDLDQIEDLFRAGVMGYISKASSFSDLLEGIERVGNGHQFLSHDINRPLKSQASPHLTLQEKRVLALLTEGHSAKEIAEFLEISVKTVYIHRARIIQKLGTKNLIQLRNKALKLGIELPHSEQAAQSG